jgi:exodeoxyribonuclease-3
MKIVSWNVNSVRARLNNIAEFINEENPDILLMQELKCVNEVFPQEFFEELGYSVAVHGQKSFNGVAIAAKGNIEDVVRGIPDYRDDAARYIEASVDGVRVCNLYMPNGNPIGTPKFDYKLEFMQAFNKYAKQLRQNYRNSPLILGGDLNVAPSKLDVFSEDAFAQDAVFQVETQTEFKELLSLGYVDVFRKLNPNSQEYSYWGYMGGEFRKNQGCRIDFIMFPEENLAQVKSCHIAKEVRAKPTASDHAPMILEFI